MGKLTRPTETKIFGSTALAAELTPFGSSIPSTDINLILNSLEAQRGWGTIGANGFPPMEWFNALGYGLSYYNAYLMQQGIPEWTALQNYYINSYVVGSDGKLYRSKTGIDGTPNVGNTPVGDTTNWEDPNSGYAPLASPALTGVPTVNGKNIETYPYRNRIINGAMNINQINGTTAVTPTIGAYIADQWSAGISQASKLTFQQVEDAPSGFKYSTKITVASQYSPLATDSFFLQQKIEGQNIIDFQFGTAGAVTINTSLNIKGSIAGTYSCSIRNGAGTRSYIGTVTVGASWGKVSINLVGANDGTWTTDNTTGLVLAIDLGSGINFNTTKDAWQVGNFLRTSGSVTFVNQVVGSTLNITGVQLEKVPTGAVQGTDYEWLPIGEEERRCARYLPVIYYVSGLVFGDVATGRLLMDLPIATRVPITGISYPAIAGLTLWHSNGGNVTITGLTFSSADTNRNIVLAFTGASTGLIAGGLAQSKVAFKITLLGAQL